MSKNSGLEVRCRLDSGLWVLAVIWFALGLPFIYLAFTDPPKTPWLWCGFIALYFAFSGLPLFFTVWPWFHMGIVANDNGLLLRGYFRSTFLQWKEINDYYFRKQEKVVLPYIAANGREWTIYHAYQNRAELQEFVKQKAIASRAKEWQLFGTRTFDEWPRVFRYKDTNPIWLWLFAFGATFLLLALMVGEPLLRGGWNNIGNNASTMFNGFSPFLAVAFVLTILLVCSAQPFLIVAVLLPRIQASRAYLQQTVTADLRGLVFQTPQEHTPIAWDRVLDLYLEPVAGTLQSADRCVVVTARGESAFLSTIVDDFILREIIKTYAKNAQSKEWAYKVGRDRDNLKTPIQFQAKAGTKVFHFRTRTARAMMWFSTLLVYSAPVSVIFGGKFKTNSEIIGVFLFLFPLAVAVIFGWLCYFKTHIVLDERGFATYGLRKSRFIAWNEIESYTVSSDKYFLVIKSDGQKTRILQMFSDIANFKNEVQNRAINSANREWKQTQ